MTDPASMIERIQKLIEAAIQPHSPAETPPDK